MALLLSACPSGGTGSDGGDGTDAGTPGPGVGPSVTPNGDCAGTSPTVCHIQTAAIAQGETVTLTDVIAISPTFDVTDTLSGFFVADSDMGEYGGVAVTMPTASVVQVAIGDVVEITGEVDEFSFGDAVGSETQLKATSVTVVRAGTAPTAVEVADFGLLADPQLGEKYEGVLVALRSVEVTQGSNGFEFAIGDGNGTELTIGNKIFNYAGLQGEVIGSITGVVQYSPFASNGAGAFVLLPRSADDIVSDSRPEISITSLRDATDPDYFAPCDQDTFSGCNTVTLQNMVVISEAFHISDSATRGPLMGFYIADPNAVTDGRLTANSGIKVTISPDDTSGDVTRNDFDFSQEDAFPHNFVNPNDAPNVGDVVTVTGQNATFYGSPQLRFVSYLEKVGEAATVDGVTMPEPALFTGAEASALATTATGISSYDGVLVELADVSTTEACVPVEVQGVTDRDFGYFRVTGDAEIGRSLDDTFSGYYPYDAVNNMPVVASDQQTCSNVSSRCADSREVGQTFTSLKGIVDVSFDVHRVEPRAVTDIVGPTLAVDTCQ